MIAPDYYAEIIVQMQSRMLSYPTRGLPGGGGYTDPTDPSFRAVTLLGYYENLQFRF